MRTLEDVGVVGVDGCEQGHHALWQAGGDVVLVAPDVGKGHHVLVYPVIWTL